MFFCQGLAATRKQGAENYFIWGLSGEELSKINISSQSKAQGWLRKWKTELKIIEKTKICTPAMLTEFLLKIHHETVHRYMQCQNPDKEHFHICCAAEILEKYGLGSFRCCIWKEKFASVYRPFPDIACCHGSHHFRTIGSIVAGKKRAPAGVLASDVDPITVVPSCFSSSAVSCRELFDLLGFREDRDRGRDHCWHSFSLLRELWGCGRGRQDSEASSEVHRGWAEGTHSPCEATSQC